MRKFPRILKSNNGSILVTVLLLFTVLFILTISILSINISNVKQVISQENSLKAYYLAYAGIELGYAALIADDNELLIEFNDKKIDNLYDSIDYGENDEDKISITISLSEDESNINISSRGVHNASNSSSTLEMTFPITNPSMRTWN